MQSLHSWSKTLLPCAAQPTDVLVLGTDGLWDNCFDEEIASVIK